LLVAVAVIAPLVFWRATLDIFGIVKATAVAAVAIAVLAVAGVRVPRTGRIVLPLHPAVLAALAGSGVGGRAHPAGNPPGHDLPGAHER
jgi:hypothetical protein